MKKHSNAQLRKYYFYLSFWWNIPLKNVFMKKTSFGFITMCISFNLFTQFFCNFYVTIDKCLFLFLFLVLLMFEQIFHSAWILPLEFSDKISPLFCVSMFSKNSESSDFWLDSGIKCLMDYLKIQDS